MNKRNKIQNYMLFSRQHGRLQLLSHNDQYWHVVEDGWFGRKHEWFQWKLPTLDYSSITDSTEGSSCHIQKQSTMLDTEWPRIQTDPWGDALASQSCGKQGLPTPPPQPPTSLCAKNKYTPSSPAGSMQKYIIPTALPRRVGRAAEPSPKRRAIVCNTQRHSRRASHNTGTPLETYLLPVLCLSQPC